MLPTVKCLEALVFVKGKKVLGVVVGRGGGCYIIFNGYFGDW